MLRFVLWVSGVALAFVSVIAQQSRISLEIIRTGGLPMSLLQDWFDRTMNLVLSDIEYSLNSQVLDLEDTSRK